MRIVLSLLLFFSFGVAVFGQELGRPLIAPGGFITIPPDIDYESVANRTDMTEVLALSNPNPELQGEARFNPNVWATNVRHVRDVWCLQFSFKPVRIIDVDIPNDAGNFDQKKVWYLVYSVKNLGPAQLDERRINSVLGSAVPAGNEKVLPVPTDLTSYDLPRSAELIFRGQTGIFEPKPGNEEPIRFVPTFILATNRLVLGTNSVVDPETGKTEWETETTAIAYTDRIIPLALLKIKERERRNDLETTVSITTKEIAPGQEVWGVAMWTDVDPRINEFSIFVGGLTNAYRWLNRVTEAGEYLNTGKVGEGRIIKQRVLKTDWWRPGDPQSLSETQIHFGAREIRTPESIFDQTGRMSPEERRKIDEAVQQADTNVDGWVSPAERAIFHLIRQDWLKPSFGYEWIFL
jgi:hypothetical protein